MSKFDDFTRDVLNGTKKIAVGSLKEFVTQIETDAQSFLESSRVKLQKWTAMLAEKKLDKDEFAILVRSQISLATMHALTLTGIAAARLKRVRDAIIELVINTAVTKFLP